MLKPLPTLLLLVFVGQLVFDSPVLAGGGCGAPPAPLERLDAGTDPHRHHHSSHSLDADAGPENAAHVAHGGTHDQTGDPADGCDCGCINGLHCAPSAAAIADPTPLTLAFTGTSLTRLAAPPPTLQPHDRRLERPPA